MDIIERVLKTIENHELLKKGDSVLVALSGGPDSVALLHLLLNIQEKYNLKLAAIHLDHSIRAGSPKDRQFCHGLCKDLKVKLYSRRMDVEKLAKTGKMTIEEAGRKARYDYFQSISSKYGFRKIATGHTMDDNAETVLFNIIRGSGLKGLSGIPVKRGNIIRPLIDIGKPELIKWLAGKKVKFITDSTNRSLRYSRNKVRRKIIPEIERVNPEFVKSLARLSKNISEDIELIDSITVLAYDDALLSQGNSKIVLDLQKLEKYDTSLGKKAVAEAFYRLTGAKMSPSFELLSRANETIKGRSGAKSPLGKGVWIEKSQGKISVFKQPKMAYESGATPLLIPGTTEMPGMNWIMKTKLLKKSEIKTLITKPFTALLDNKKVIEPMIRLWQEGDRIKPFGMKGTKLISDLFVDKKVPTFARKEVPLVLSKDKVAWVGGVAISDDFKVGPLTKEVLRIELCRF